MSSVGRDGERREWEPCSCGWPEKDCAERHDHVSDCVTYRCAACQGDPEAHGLHVCGKEPFS